MRSRYLSAWLLSLICAGFTPVLLQRLFAQPHEVTPKPPDTLAVQYAQAQLKLAEANLAKITQTNQRSARSVPADVVAQYQRDLDLAKSQLRTAETAPRERNFSIWLSRAESAVKTANREWKAGVEVNRRAPGSVDPIDLFRLQLRADVARLNLERGRALATASAQEQTDWQLETLNGEVARLKQQLLRSAPGAARYYPIWPY